MSRAERIYNRYHFAKKRATRPARYWICDHAGHRDAIDPREAQYIEAGRDVSYEDCPHCPWPPPNNKPRKAVL